MGPGHDTETELKLSMRNQLEKLHYLEFLWKQCAVIHLFSLIHRKDFLFLGDISQKTHFIHDVTISPKSNEAYLKFGDETQSNVTVVF